MDALKNAGSWQCNRRSKGRFIAIEIGKKKERGQASIVSTAPKAAFLLPSVAKVRFALLHETLTMEIDGNDKPSTTTATATAAAAGNHVVVVVVPRAFYRGEINCTYMYALLSHI